MESSNFDIAIIGAGPGGYVAAIRAAQLGLKTACIDENHQLGGTCLRVGCIPSKAMLESSHQFHHASHSLAPHGITASDVTFDLSKMLGRKEKVVSTLTGGIQALFKKNGVTPIHGRGSLAQRDGRAVVHVRHEGKDHQITAPHIVIATGSKPATIPGIDLEQPLVDTSTDALAYENVPPHLAVIGGGYIGLELGTVWHRLGSKVTIVEYLDRLLPGMDSELAAEAHKVFKKQGLDLRLKSAVEKVQSTKKGVRLHIKDADPLDADRVLVAVGRSPNTGGLNLAELGVHTDKRGRITVDADYKTGAEGIYAIGDVIPGPMLAHKAEEEGIACVEKIVTGYGHVNYDAIPAVVYTHPEIATIGQTEDALKEAHIEYKKGTFPFAANGRARSLDDTTGKVKVLADANTDRILGIHIIGPSAGDLIAECTAAMNFGATAEDLAYTSHAHPTLSEAVKEACLATASGAIHM